MDLQKIKAQINEWKERLDSAEGADEIAFCNRKLEKLEEELLLAQAGAKAPKPVAKKNKKPAVKKDSHTPDPFEHDGKTYVFGKDEDYCTVLRKQWQERQDAAEKSQHKYKTKSLSLKISDGITHPIKNVLNNISDTEISKNPKRLLVKLRSLKKNAKALLADCKSLAPQLTQKDINGPIAVIEDMIEEIEESIAGDKMNDGGNLDNFKVKESTAGDKEGWHFSNGKNISSALYSTKQKATTALKKYLETGKLDMYGDAE